MTRSRWTKGVPSLSVAVRCGDGLHEVRWRRGGLVLVHHDVVADRVLVALGGESPACLEVLRSWRLGYIEAEPPAASAGLVRALSSVARWMSGGGPQPMVLPEPLRRLREASVLHTWGRGLRAGASVDADESQATFLDRSIARRVRDVFEPQARAAAGPLARREIDVAVGEEGPAAEGRADDALVAARVRVERSWLTDVWVRGLEDWDGGLLLAWPAGAPHALVARWRADGEGGACLEMAAEPVG